jgi:hypothetical protein
MSKTYRNKDGKKKQHLQDARQRKERRRRPKGIFVLDPVAEYYRPSDDRRTA